MRSKLDSRVKLRASSKQGRPQALAKILILEEEEVLLCRGPRGSSSTRSGSATPWQSRRGLSLLTLTGLPCSCNRQLPAQRPGTHRDGIVSEPDRFSVKHEPLLSTRLLSSGLKFTSSRSSFDLDSATRAAQGDNEVSSQRWVDRAEAGAAWAPPTQVSFPGAVSSS